MYKQVLSLSKIRCYLDKHSLACIIHAFVTCRLDYGNALLCGYPESQIQKLQRVQNVAARLISGHRKYDHITPVLKELHWLPVVKRLQFNVVTTVFKAMHDTAPAYLQELIVPYAPSRVLRSREHNLLCVPFTRSTVAGSRAFSIAGPKLWNALPQYLHDISDISTFKKQLKAYLFLQHYGLWLLWQSICEWHLCFSSLWQFLTFFEFYLIFNICFSILDINVLGPMYFILNFVFL